MYFFREIQVDQANEVISQITIKWILEEIAELGYIVSHISKTSKAS